MTVMTVMVTTVMTVTTVTMVTTVMMVTTDGGTRSRAGSADWLADH